LTASQGDAANWRWPDIQTGAQHDVVMDIQGRVSHASDLLSRTLSRKLLDRNRSGRQSMLVHFVSIRSGRPKRRPGSGLPSKGSARRGFIREAGRCERPGGLQLANPRHKP
jgi:hypothetical protein